MLTSVTGINWGDEGKGRIVDLLTEKADYVVRYQGGNNAGHTVVTDQGKFVLNLLPSGILHPTAVCVLGNGMVIDPDHLRHEIAMMQYMKVKVDASNLKISDKATICMPFHVRQDVLEEERLSKTGSAFGSTRRGIAYAYGDKYMKKIYITPSVEFIELKKVDIITASSPLDNTDWTNGDNALVNGNDGGIYSNFH